MDEQKEICYWKVIVSLIFSILATVLVVYIGIRGIIFFMPFAIGWVVAVIASPLVKWLERRLKIVRKLGSAIIIAVVLGFIVVVGYFITIHLWNYLVQFSYDFPVYYESLSDELNLASDNITVIVNRMPRVFGDSWTSLSDNFVAYISQIAASISEPTVALAGDFAKKVPSFLVSFIVMIIAAYFFIADKDSVVIWCKKVAPQPIQKRMELVVYQLKYAIGGYVKAQLKIMLVVCLVLAICLSLIRVEYAILLAIFIAFLDFLPIFGTGAVLWPWAVFQILIGDYKRAAILFGIYLLTQGMRHLIQPKFVGDSIGLKPLPTLVLLYIGYQFAGVTGMIVAIPVGLIIMNLYESGAFDYILDDVKLLIEGIMKLRKR